MHKPAVDVSNKERSSSEAKTFCGSILLDFVLWTYDLVIYIFTLMLSSCGLAIGIISYQVISFEHIVVFKLENFYVQ